MAATTDREHRFMTRLWEIQAELNLSDGALAEILGVDRTLLSHTKRRDSLGKALLVAACDRFPELRELYFAPFVPSGTDIDASKQEVA